MKDGTKNIIAALILAIGMIFASYTYVEMTRYEFKTGYDKVIRTDKWTGGILIMPIGR